MNQNQDTVLPEPTHPAVVAEWLRRLTRNEFPSGSVGSNPTNCDTFGKTETKQLAPGEAGTHNPGITHCTVYKYRALTDCATGAN